MVGHTKERIILEMQITIDDIRAHWVSICMRLWADKIVPNRMIATKMSAYLGHALPTIGVESTNTLVILLTDGKKICWLSSVGTEQAVHTAIESEMGCKWDGDIVITSINVHSAMVDETYRQSLIRNCIVQYIEGNKEKSVELFQMYIQQLENDAHKGIEQD
jgi:hypothetical protein